MSFFYAKSRTCSFIGYILSLEIEELNKLEYELKVLSHLENSLGENKKDKAVDIIIKMLC